MRLLVTILSIIFIISCNNDYAQTRQKRFFNKSDGTRERLEELEKIKLLEILELNEKSMLQFFSRRKEFKENIQKLERERNAKLDRINEMVESNADDKEFKEIIDDVINIQKEINKQEENYITSLDGLLTYKQISQLLAFERNFKREVKEIILKHRREK